MELGIFLRGIVIGFAIAAPVGPIGVMCVQRTLNRGVQFGFVSGLGAATADACYGMTATLSLTAVLSFLTGARSWLSLVGGIYLCHLGIKAFRTAPANPAANSSTSGRLGAYLSIFFLTLTNPMTILSFAAIFAGLGLGNTNVNYFSASTLVGGVFLGSATWWLILSAITGLFRHRFKPLHLRWVNRISGIIIAGFGAYILIGLY
jgi:threonine/homoserine/homoserine lactone efflux protein